MLGAAFAGTAPRHDSQFLRSPGRPRTAILGSGVQPVRIRSIFEV